MTEGLLLIRRLRPIGEPAALRPIGKLGPAILEGTSGAGRIVHALAEAGVRCEPVVQAVLPPSCTVGEIRVLDLGQRFETVVLGSHLVNVPDAGYRAAFVELATRHVTPGGSVIVEHHPIDWADTAADEEPTPGAGLGMVEVRRDPPFVSAVSVFDVGGRVERQPFTARVLSEAELADALDRAGLHLARRLGPTLVEATPGA